MIVVVVWFAVVVEPGLDALGEVLGMIFRCVFVLPQTGMHSSFIRLLQAIVECLIDDDHPTQMDVVCEFVDENVFGRVGIAVQGEQILLAAGADGIFPGAAKASSPCVPESLWCHVRVLGHVGRELVMGHDHQSRASRNHGTPDVRPFRQHHVGQVCGLFERVVVDVAGTHDWVSVC